MVEKEDGVPDPDPRKRRTLHKKRTLCKKRTLAKKKTFQNSEHEKKSHNDIERSKICFYNLMKCASKAKRKQCMFLKEKKCACYAS